MNGKRGCFGTDEFYGNSPICKACDEYKPCSKLKHKENPKYTYSRRWNEKRKVKK